MNEECSDLNSFVSRNIAKSIVISNALVFCLYAARFKTYRNSHLLKANILATCFGIHNAVVGVEPVFYSYFFNKSELVPGLLEKSFDLPEFQAALAKRRAEDRQ